jgi:hypothetical protein
LEPTEIITGAKMKKSSNFACSVNEKEISVLKYYKTKRTASASLSLVLFSL